MPTCEHADITLKGLSLVCSGSVSSMAAPHRFFRQF